MEVQLSYVLMARMRRRPPAGLFLADGLSRIGMANGIHRQTCPPRIVGGPRERREDGEPRPPNQEVLDEPDDESPRRRVAERTLLLADGFVPADGADGSLGGDLLLYADC
jgi:hypothetical protein